MAQFRRRGHSVLSAAEGEARVPVGLLSSPIPSHLYNPPLNPGGLGSRVPPPWPPRFLQNHAVSGNLKGKIPILRTFWAQGPPPFGVKTLLAPPTKILDPRLLGAAEGEALSVSGTIVLPGAQTSKKRTQGAHWAWKPWNIMSSPFPGRKVWENGHFSHNLEKSGEKKSGKVKETIG